MGNWGKKMKNKKFIFSIVSVVILLLSASGSLAVTKTYDMNQGPEMELTTDKTVYTYGETVNIFLTNVGDELMCVTGPHIIIYNEDDEIVFEEACYCYWELEPGDFVTMYWHNPQVPAGEYEIEGILSGDEQDYIDTATIYIVNYDPPDPPTGPTEGGVFINYTYCITLPDNQQCQPFHVLFNFGDGTITDWLGPFGPDLEVCANHFWSQHGIYEVKVKFKDGCINQYYTEPLIVTIYDNSPPSAPEINGPDNHALSTYGKPGEEYEYTLKSEDPDGDDVFYIVDWDDGTYMDWIGPYPSGEEVTVKHTWEAQGTYTIKAKAKDIWGAESPWATKQIPISKNKIINEPFLNFLNNHLNLFPILRFLIHFVQ